MKKDGAQTEAKPLTAVEMQRGVMPDLERKLSADFSRCTEMIAHCKGAEDKDARDIYESERAYIGKLIRWIKEQKA